MSGNISRQFGSMVFNEEVMKQRLSNTCYRAWKKCVEEGTPLSLETAHRDGRGDEKLGHGPGRYPLYPLVPAYDRRYR